jgi:DNA helicase-2/ATP-dependent DNA helicase PcrA
VANAAIAANVRQFEKRLAPARQTGPKPVLVVCEDAQQQATFIAQRMLELREEGSSLNEMAVLYRSHFHALELQLELTRRDIPFSITSGIRFFEQAHIKDVAAYLKLVVNPRDELAFKRLVKMLPGIGGKSAEKLWGRYSAALPVGESEEGNIVATAVQRASEAVPKKAKVAWAQFAATVAQLETAGPRPETLIQLVIDAGYDEHLEATFTNYRTRLEDIEQLSVFARQFETTEDFLVQLALLTNVEAESQQAGDEDAEKVRLTTIHQAKGLEFDIVFVIMLCDGLFPSNRSVETEDGEEEERRLFYVAITRARNELHLCYPLIRALAGGGDTLQRPSRFLSEIPAELVEEWNLRPHEMY